MGKTAFTDILASARAAGRLVYARIRPAASVPPANGSSAPVVAQLLADWKSIGFGTPSKPAQYRVYGRNGYITNGPTYNQMITLIRLAVKDSREGRDQDALLKVAEVRRLLTKS